MSKAIFLYQAAIVGSVWWLTLGQGFVGYLLALIFWAAFTFFRAMTPKLKLIQGTVILASAAVFAEAAYIDLLLTVEKHGIFIVVGLSFVATAVLTLAFNWLSGVVYANMAKRIDDVHDFAESPRFSYENVKEVVKSGTLSACGISDVLDTRAPVYLKVPFEEKDEVRELGAKWDPSRREWYVPPGVDIHDFERWIQVGRQTSLNQMTVHGAAALLFWHLAESIGVANANDEVLQSHGDCLFRQPFTAKILREFRFDDMPRQAQKEFAVAVKDEAFRFARNEENMNGIAYVEDAQSGRTPEAKHINTDLLNVIPKGIEKAGWKIEKLGRLCLRHPLPAVVFSEKEPRGDVFEVLDTSEALGFHMPMFLTNVSSQKIGEDLFMSTGIFYIPVPDQRQGSLWDTAILNSFRFVEKFEMYGKSGYTSVKVLW